MIKTRITYETLETFPAEYFYLVSQIKKLGHEGWFCVFIEHDPKSDSYCALLQREVETLDGGGE